MTCQVVISRIFPIHYYYMGENTMIESDRRIKSESPSEGKCNFLFFLKGRSSLDIQRNLPNHLIFDDIEDVIWIFNIIYISDIFQTVFEYLPILPLMDFLHWTKSIRLLCIGKYDEKLSYIYVEAQISNKFNMVSILVTVLKGCRHILSLNLEDNHH
jgi:hypothetical protein